MATAFASSSRFRGHDNLSDESDVYFRSRTMLFLSYRDSRSSTSYPPKRPANVNRNWKGKGRAEDEEEAIGLLTKNDEENDESSSALPPTWIHYSEEVDRIINDVGPKIITLDKLHAKHLLPGFTDRSAEVQRIHELTTEITSDFRKAHTSIQKIQNISQQSNYSGAEDKVAKSAQIALAANVKDLSSQFRKKQSAYFKKLKGYDNVQSQDTKNDSLLAVDDDEQLIRTSLLEVEDDMSSRIDQRAREIAGIAESISDLAELFRELNVMVIDQGTMLDRIDYNVETMAHEVTVAAEELQTASKYQRRSGKCQIIFLLVLLIFGVIILLIYRPRSKAEPISTTPAVPPTYVK